MRKSSDYAVHPEDYQKAFREGVAAYYSENGSGQPAVSPYLQIGGYETMAENIRALAFESGWWFAAFENGDPRTQNVA